VLGLAVNSRRVPGGHLPLDSLEKVSEAEVQAIAQLREVDLDLVGDPARIAGKDQDPVAHQHGFFLAISDVVK
jgi:hypothetical protein